MAWEASYDCRDRPGARTADPPGSHGSRGYQQEIDAFVDTGYTGWLTLPPDMIAALNLRRQSFGRGLLALHDPILDAHIRQNFKIPIARQKGELMLSCKGGENHVYLR
jgi:hypothetical protein